MATSGVNETYHLPVGICILLASLLLVNITTASCPTGRVYLGNVNLSHVGQVGSNGVYTVQVGQVHAAHPVYKHTHRHLYIYFTRTAMGTYWVVAQNVTSNLSDVTIRMSSASAQPISTVETRWQLKQNGVWTTIPKLRTMCVNEDFGPCTSGKLNVSGLPLTARRHGRFMGNYSLYNISQSLRPTYIKDGGSEVLVYRHNLWVFTPDINSNSLAIFTKDSAFLPEFILEEWAYLSGFGLQSKRLKIKCIEDANVETYAAAHHRGNGCSLTQPAGTELQQAEPQPSTTLQPTQDLLNNSTRPVPDSPTHAGTVRDDSIVHVLNASTDIITSDSTTEIYDAVRDDSIWHGLNASMDIITSDNATEMHDAVMEDGIVHGLNASTDSISSDNATNRHGDTNGTVSIQNTTYSGSTVSIKHSLDGSKIEMRSMNTSQGENIQQEQTTETPELTEERVISESTQIPIQDNVGNESNKWGDENRYKSILDKDDGGETDAIMPRSNGSRPEVDVRDSYSPHTEDSDSETPDTHSNGNITYLQNKDDDGAWRPNIRTQGMALKPGTGDVNNKDGNAMTLELSTSSKNINDAQGMSLEVSLTTESMSSTNTVNEVTGDMEHDSSKSAERIPSENAKRRSSMHDSITTDVSVDFPSKDLTHSTPSVSNDLLLNVSDPQSFHGNQSTIAILDQNTLPENGSDSIDSMRTPKTLSAILLRAYKQTTRPSTMTSNQESVYIQTNLPVTDQALPREGAQQAASATGCQQDVTSCENGEVTETSSGIGHQVTCKCQQGYYGLRCEKEIRCGAAPAVAMATLQEVVEEGLMVMAVYTCDVGYHSDAGHVAVCGMDTRWQYLPECRSDVFSGYDWSEVSP